MRRIYLVTLLAAAGVLIWTARRGAAEGPARPAAGAAAAHLRRPVALALIRGRLLVANRSAGTVSVVDPTTASVRSEAPVGDGLDDLALCPDGSSLVAVD